MKYMHERARTDCWGLGAGCRGRVVTFCLANCLGLPFDLSESGVDDELNEGRGSNWIIPKPDRPEAVVFCFLSLLLLVITPDGPAIPFGSEARPGFSPQSSVSSPILSPVGWPKPSSSREARSKAPENACIWVVSTMIENWEVLQS